MRISRSFGVFAPRDDVSISGRSDLPFDEGENRQRNRNDQDDVDDVAEEADHRTGEPEDDEDRHDDPECLGHEWDTIQLRCPHLFVRARGTVIAPESSSMANHVSGNNRSRTFLTLRAAAVVAGLALVLLVLWEVRAFDSLRFPGAARGGSSCGSAPHDRA